MIPLLKAISNLLWILGIAIILADISIHEYIAHISRIKIKRVFKYTSFKKPFLGAVVFILSGICASIFIHYSEKVNAISIDDTIKFAPTDFEGNKVIRDDIIIMIGNGAIETKKIQFEKSEYEIKIISRGSKALGETAQLRVYVGISPIDDFFTSTEYKEKIIIYKSNKKTLHRLRIEFTNDFYDPEKKLDRNAYIKSISIAKKIN